MSTLVTLQTPYGPVVVLLQCPAELQPETGGDARGATDCATPEQTAEAGLTGTASVDDSTSTELPQKRPAEGEPPTEAPATKMQAVACSNCNKWYTPQADWHRYCSWNCRKQSLSKVQ